MRTHIHACVRTHIHACVRTHMRAYMQSVRTYTCMRACRASVHACVHAEREYLRALRALLATLPEATAISKPLTSRLLVAVSAMLRHNPWQAALDLCSHRQHGGGTSVDAEGRAHDLGDGEGRGHTGVGVEGHSQDGGDSEGDDGLEGEEEEEREEEVEVGVGRGRRGWSRLVEFVPEAQTQEELT